MAKTKQDYFNAGAAAYRACEYPEDREYTSWQDKAWLAGYTGAEEEQKLIADCEANGCGMLVKAVETEDGVDVQAFAKADYMPAPVIEHIKRLKDRMKHVRPTTRHRYLTKIEHLEAKYATRAAHA